MASKSLSFLLFGEDVTAGKAFKKLAADAEKSGGAIAGAFSGKNLLAVGALAAGLGVAASAAGNFQQKTNVLVTAAGESVKNLDLIRKGILNISTSTGTSWQQVTDGMYVLEKAGYRGADALKVETAAAQGAREENASLGTVTQAMTSIMASYHIQASGSVMVMNELKTAAGESKTTMESFAGALSTVLPIASANKVSFADVAGAMATMTQHGTSADEATQELSNTLRNLAKPNAVAIKEMAQLGLSSVDVATKVGDGPGGRGLVGTLNLLSETVLKKMGPAGTVLLNTFNQSKVAAADADTMFNALPPAARKVAQAYQAGTLTLKEYRTEVKALPANEAALAIQWATTENSAKGFQSTLRTGLAQNQTYSDAIGKMTGGVNGLNTTLQTTGSSLSGTNARIKAIADSAKGAGTDVSGWASTQQLFNVKLDELKQKAAAAGIGIGTQLIPVLSSAADYTLKHEKAAELLIGTLLAVKGAVIAVSLAESAMGAVTAFATTGAAAFALMGQVRDLESAYLVGMYAMEAATGPVGLAIGAITLAVGIATKGFGLFGRSAHDQVKPVQALTDAITADGDAFGNLTRKQLENSLQTKGLYDAALKLGVGQGTLTSAAMGNEKALGLVNDAIARASKAMADNKRPVAEYIAGTLNQTQASKDAYAAWMRSQSALKDQLIAANKLKDGLGGLKGQLDASFHAANNLAIADGKAKEASLTHAAAVVAASSKLQLESIAAQAVTTKLHGVHDAINTIPALKQTAVQVAAEIALAKLRSVHDEVNSIPRSFTINIGANNNVGQAVHDAVNSIPGKPHKATGGTIGGHGGPTADDQLIWASTGEEVIAAAPAAKHRPLLKAINAGMFASGGTVGGVAAATQATAWAVSQDIPNMLANVLGSPAALAAALSKLINDVHTAVTKNIAPDSLLKTLENENGQFLKLAAQRKFAASEVAAGTAKLNTLRASYAQELASVSSGVTSQFDLTSLGAGPGGPTTMGQLLALEQGRVNQAGAFAGNLGTLKGKGLTSGLISQLGNAGVGSASDVAGILAGASAGDIKQLNALYAKDQSFGNLAGRQVAGADYGAGIAAASKFVDSWSKMSKTLDAESRAMGAHIAHQVAVNVHVTAGIGANGTQIGRDIVAALEHYANNGGKITISKAIR